MPETSGIGNYIDSSQLYQSYQTAYTPSENESAAEESAEPTTENENTGYFPTNQGQYIDLYA